MPNKENIPTINPSEMNGFHSSTTDWLPVLSFSSHQDYHINRIEDITNKSSFQVLPHRKTLHDFIFLKKGRSIRSKGLNHFDFSAASMFFLPAYQITQHEMMSDDAEGFYCHFDEKIFGFLPKNYLSKQFPFFQYQSNPVITMSDTSLKTIESLLERLLILYNDAAESNMNLIAIYLLAIFEEIKNEIPLETSKTKNSFFDITEKYKHALSQNIYNLQNISDYAELLHITPNYLNKCVKSSTNKTAQDLLKEMIILEAKTLLKYSDLHISEIAVKLCDQTPSNFARFFKKQTGVTPLEYLQMC
ncbi:helix-turn-helix domain-containing protein [Flavobacterium maritimum]|jgi:AraC-like DNA-binding protein|uniref:helix-turn-helix domain-containing protein n=1 Tax=Flavobacterium maritimum TaxID=3149042 RepID=UPI0032B60792